MQLSMGCGVISGYSAADAEDAQADLPPWAALASFTE
jgi:hypothetical protein